LRFESKKPGISTMGDKIELWKALKKSPRYLYLIGGFHGDEVEGVYVLNQLFKWLSNEDQGLEMNLPMVVIPILNTDGYRMGTRCNATGVDLNRNLPAKNWSESHQDAKYHPGKKAGSESETSYLVKRFKKWPPYLVMSFHSWKPMINYDGNLQVVAEYLSTYNQYPVCDDVGYETPGSLGSYCAESLNVPVLTLEYPRISKDLSLAEIWNQNEEGLKELFMSNLLAPHNF